MTTTVAPANPASERKNQNKEFTSSEPAKKIWLRVPKMEKLKVPDSPIAPITTLPFSCPKSFMAYNRIRFKTFYVLFRFFFGEIV